MNTIYASRVKEFTKEEGQVLYRGINERTGKLITIVSYGHLLFDGHDVMIRSAKNHQILMVVNYVTEVNNYRPSTVYVCD